MTDRPTDIVCVSTADWDAPLWTNKQHLMSGLADRGHRVLYMDSLGLRAPSASGQDVGRIAARLRAWRPLARPVRPGVLRDSPLVVPLHGRPAVRALNRRLLAARLWRNERRHRLVRPVIWAYSPLAAELFDPERHGPLVYHCVDNLAAYPGVDAEMFGALETATVRAAAVSIGSSRPLVAHIEARGARDAVYWPNPADTEAYATARAAEPLRGRTIGFIGAVQEHKVDVPLVIACARLRPEWEFVLAGPVGIGLAGSEMAEIDLPPNVRLLGAVERAALPELVAGFDVGIIPYRHNAYTEGVFPMKVYEYLAAGLPVVSTPLPSLVGEVEHVEFAGEAEAFVARLDAVLEADSAPLRAARTAYAAGHSWSARVDEAEALLAGLPAPA